MNKKIKIAMIMGKMNGGGVESVIMNYFRKMNKDIFEVTFFIDEDSTKIPRDELVKFGAKIVIIPSYKDIFKYRKKLKKLFRTIHYDVVHSNINSINFIPLSIAKKAGVKMRISHNHSTAAPGETKKNVFKFVFKCFSRVGANVFMSPTFYAGEWLFGKKIASEQLIVLKNAIEINDFIYSKKNRSEVRKKLGINEEDYVIGNIGRMVWQKNQSFLLDILNELKIKGDNIKLIIVGEGPLKDDLLNKTKKLQLEEIVIFVNNNKFVNKYYSAMDLFLFPSNYEGLGMVAIESLVAGLNVIASENVPKDVAVNGRTTFLPNDDLQSWTKEICLQKETLDKKREINLVDFKSYDITNAVTKLEDIYKSSIYYNES